MSLEIANIKTNETLIRIGHFSHVECITLDGVREPKTRSVSGRPMPYGTTRTLANGLYPFGWAKLEFVDLESVPRSENGWPFSIKDLEEKAKIKAGAAAEAAKAAEVAKQVAREAEEKHLAEEKRKAELEAMSPEERDIVLINDPDINEHQVVEIYSRIDGFSEENKIKAARALKQYWEANGKWRSKDCSKKQKVKVQKVAKILSEQ
jgi:hypothetical protein